MPREDQIDFVLDKQWFKLLGSQHLAVISVKIESVVKEEFSLTPRGIIESLELLNPIFQKTAAYGHFGRKAEGNYFTWERTDKAQALKKALS